eukprot:1835289-Rhodomonas_salina.1
MERVSAECQHQSVVRVHHSASANAKASPSRQGGARTSRLRRTAGPSSKPANNPRLCAHTSTVSALEHPNRCP